MVCQWKLWAGAKGDFLLQDSKLILLNGISPIYFQGYLSTNKYLCTHNNKGKFNTLLHTSSFKKNANIIALLGITVSTHFSD